MVSFSLSSAIVVGSALFQAANANLDELACSGAGACIRRSNCDYAGASWTCPSGGNVTAAEASQPIYDLESGHSGPDVQVASDDEFPLPCLLVQPSATAIKFKTSSNNVTYYAFVEYTCPQTEAIETCYFENKNPSNIYTCNVVRDGQTCKSDLPPANPADCPADVVIPS